MSACRAHLLVVEDDPGLSTQIVEIAHRAGFAATVDDDGASAAARDLDPFDLVLLDLMLPGKYGLDTLRDMRASSDVPVVVLTARNQTADKVRALALGADDYVTKPFAPQELIARVEARLRRPAMVRGSRIVFGELAIDRARREVRVAGDDVHLTPTELALLSALVQRADAAISRSELLRAVGDDDDSMLAERNLDAHVSRLRKKLRGEGDRIATVWGIGYRFRP